MPLYFLSAERVFLAACNRQENGINLAVNGRQLEMSSLCQGCIARIMLRVQLNFCNYWAVALYDKNLNYRIIEYFLA
jgi:hypothetical protein